ncbi:MAG: uroporphyrinogen-III C-methyltransferase [Candidatus Latescibacteria bacterium]|nr:uroporphyrinogen-III C-methyltransferase [Candidatus Latescibacterota bacterium]
MIYLVGAGPGDPGLITVKALELLKRADVVLYDRLVDKSLLTHTKPECTLIDVGKSSGEHTINQTGIINILIEIGKKGFEVVRLKGGDPFLFGRGGEEAERLREEGIPFEIVPGVSALTAVPAYAGIPLTHRDYASSVGIATGHGADGKNEDPVRWRNLAQSVDTIVVFMGVGNLDTIIHELMAGGLSSETPAALIEQGTTLSQKVAIGTLATIRENASQVNISSPALLIVGKTVQLHETLQWYNPKPLAGLRIGVTRTLDQSKNFSDKLHQLGAEPILMPTIKIIDTIDTPNVKQVLQKIQSYHCILFFSVNGVESFFRALKKENIASETLDGILIGAIGPATAGACAKYGLDVNIKAETYIAEGMVEAIMEKTDVAAKRFLLVRSDLGRNIVPDCLRMAGASVDEASFYSTQPEMLDPLTIDSISHGEIDIITFTSSSTVDGLFKTISENDIPDSVVFASIGPQTTKTIKKHHKTPEIRASEYTTDGLIEALIKYRRKENLR